MFFNRFHNLFTHFNTSNVEVPLLTAEYISLPIPDFNTSNVEVPLAAPTTFKPSIMYFNTSNVEVPRGYLPGSILL